MNADTAADLAPLGLDPVRHAAVGVGLGFERIACLRDDIDDLRTVSVARVAPHG